MASATGEPIRVSSAGTSGWDGSPATDEAIQAAADRTTDIGEHRARRLKARHIEEADLILGMTTEHRDTAIQLVPTAAARTFTLKELVQLLEALPVPDNTDEAAEPSAERLRARVAEADALRLDGFEGNRFDLDVVDPIGLSIDTYRAVAWELDDLVGRLVDGLFGKEAAPTSLASMWKDGE
jgi:protein-tyrosine-phosphatase